MTYTPKASNRNNQNLLDIYTASFEGAGGTWARYADAAGTAPVDGTGGTPNTSFTVATSTTFGSRWVLELTKNTGASRQGEGISANFSIPSRLKAKMLTVEFDYIVAAGTFTAGTATTDSDITVWIYDVTNSTLIPVTPNRLMSNSTSLVDTFRGQFQAASNSTSYRLILHIGTTTNADLGMRFDNFSITPTSITYGTPVTDWQAFTPVSNSTTNVTLTGWWRRVGDTAEYTVHFNYSGANSDGHVFINLPTGQVIDTAKLPATIRDEALGIVSIYDSGTAQFVGHVAYKDTTSVYLQVGRADSTYLQQHDFTPSSGAPQVMANLDRVTARFALPIAGWGSNVQISNNADNRVVAMRAALTTAQSGIADKVIPFNSIGFDTHGTMGSSATGVYTVPVSGYYRVWAQVGVFSLDGATNPFIEIRKNGTATVQSYGSNYSATSTAAYINASDLINCVAGDTISVYIDGDASFDLENTNGRTSFSIERVSSNTTIAASETVTARYGISASSTNLSLADNTAEILDFDTKDFDSHSAVTTGASWKFTAPVSGVYNITAVLQLAGSGGWAAGERVFLTLHKNNNATVHTYMSLQYMQATHGTNPALNGAALVQLNAGDYIDIRANQNSGGALGITSGTTLCWVGINKVGNY
jgi:hypothetical protein